MPDKPNKFHSQKIVLKKIAQTVLVGTIATSALLMLLTIAAFTPRKWGGNATPEADCNFTVYVTGDHFHTNLIVPVKTAVFDWSNRVELGALRGEVIQAQYLQFGWGDRIFYAETPSWEKMDLLSAARSLFYWQNAAALFVKAHATLPQPAHEQTQCIRLSQADYLALTQFLQASFQRDGQGRSIPIRKDQNGQSGFFAATGHYSLLKTCNSWTADGLRAANVNTPVWGGLAPAVLRQVGNGCGCGGKG